MLKAREVKKLEKKKKLCCIYICHNNAKSILSRYRVFLNGPLKTSHSGPLTPTLFFYHGGQSWTLNVFGNR